MSKKQTQRTHPSSNLSQPLKQSSQISQYIPQSAKLPFKIVVIGQSFVGKTSLIQKFVKENYSAEYSVTVGADFSCRAVQVEDTLVQLQIWDTCGHDLYRSVTTSFYRGACGVFLVFALNDRKSFEQLDFWYREFMDNGSPNALIILIGTKSDQQHTISTEEGLKKMKKMNGLFYVQTSAETGQQIEQLFHKTAQLMYKKFKISHEFRVLAQPRKHNNSIIVSAADQQEGQGQGVGRMGRLRGWCC